MESYFTVQRIDRTLTFHSDEDGDYTDEHDPWEEEPADLREALDAINSNCWDNIDQHGDGTVICYPADSNMNIRTSEYESFQMVIKAKHPHWIDRLVSLYYNT